MIEARCAVCHRVEQHEGATVTVVVEGGARVPRSAAAAAWPSLRRVRAGELGLVGVCAACGGPLLGPPGPPLSPTWTLVDRTDRFEVPLDGSPIRGPDGPWTETRLEAFLAARYAPRAESGGLFGVIAILPFFLIVIPWLLGMAFALLFIIGFLTS